LGIERRYEKLLRSRPGSEAQLADRHGNILSVYRDREPRDGADVVLSLDPALQRAAESMLDHALRRRGSADAHELPRPVGGAILVMNVATGEILAAASAPRFDPNLFENSRSEELQQLMTDDGHPLFDRTIKMAIPPGSVFKIVSAIALLETGAVDADEPFECQGYLEHPDRQRCYIYQRYGVGHGELSLRDALAQSCNVYFFHFAGRMGARPLANWAQRLGLGAQSGIDLPDEAAGHVPQPDVRDRKHNVRSYAEAQALAIGQSSLTVTPLQIVRLMAAVANGGNLVCPRVAVRLNAKPHPGSDSPATSAADELAPGSSHKIGGLKPETLATVREGLRRVVADPNGTAYGTVRLQSVAIAGKTGTAQTGPSRQDHAWFAGYVPAERPQFAFVVVLEHGGGAAAAGPLAKRLVLAMQELGYFDATRNAEELSKTE
jgi:penicillin-binding protein 2